MKQIAIIGTGFSSLILANELKNNDNFDVTFFEKSRGVGGRIATRHNEEWEFDHGAPCFEANETRFLEFLTPLTNAGIIAKWQPRIVNSHMTKIDSDLEYFIGTPKMNSLPKALSYGFKIEFETTILAMQNINNQWFLQNDNTHKASNLFDIIITSTPPEQVYNILPEGCSYKNTLQSYKMLPQFVTLVGFNEEIDFNFDIMQVQNSKIEKIVINHNKISRNSKPSVLVYSNKDFASENINVDKEQIGEILLSEFQSLTKIYLIPQMIQTHKWLYSVPRQESRALHLCDNNLNIFSCGDWLSNGTIEGAFLSGIALAKYLLENI